MNLLRKFEKVYVVVSMLFFAAGIIQRAVAEGEKNAAPDGAYRIGELIVYAILAPLVVIHWREIRRGLLHSGWIFALCVLAIASAAWASNPRYTLLHAMILSAMTLFAIYVASCFDWEEQLSLFGWLSVVAVVGSAFMAVLVPSYGISQDIHQGAVKGIFPHKNLMGPQMVFAILTLGLGKPRAIPFWLRNMALVMACLLLALSNAVTSILTLLVCLAMYPVFHLVRFSGQKKLPLWVPLVPVFAMGSFFVIANLNIVLEATGRSATLTGRTGIWRAVLGAIARHPWLGYGYDIFWNRPSSDLAGVRFALQGYQIPHAHNGYLDLLLAMGMAGLVIFICSFVTNFWRAGRLFQAAEVRGAKWPMFMLLFIAVFNVAESGLLRPQTFLWIPYVTIYVSLSLMRLEQRQESPAALAGEIEGADDVDSESRDRAGDILPEYGT
jgi:exopolysaccharide production protein ExoQ